nr:MAG TPA: STOP protein [Caudoviricetes sp.]
MCKCGKCIPFFAVIQMDSNRKLEIINDKRL